VIVLNQRLICCRWSRLLTNNTHAEESESMSQQRVKHLNPSPDRSASAKTRVQQNGLNKY
jgi:hypothetical protein